MPQPLGSQHSPASSGFIWLHAYQICLHLYCGEPQLQGSEQPQSAFAGLWRKTPAFPPLCYVLENFPLLHAWGKSVQPMSDPYNAFSPVMF